MSRAPKEAQLEGVVVVVDEEGVLVVPEGDDSEDALTGSSVFGAEHAPHKISRDPSFLTMTGLLER